MSEPIDPQLRAKHLEMIQAIITRVAGYSAAVKNLCVTVVTALGGFAIANTQEGLGALATALIVIFALLDAQYLRVERRFRTLFDHVRKSDWKQATDFSLDISQAAPPPLVKSFLSWSVWTFYLPLAIVAVAIERLIA